MKRNRPKPGDEVSQRDWCVRCRDKTRQLATVLEAIAGVWRTATEWRCEKCGGWAI